jgi:hypothetical protein
MIFRSTTTKPRTKHPELHTNKSKLCIAIPHHQIVQTADASLVARARGFDNPSLQEHLKMFLDASKQRLLRGKSKLGELYRWKNAKN